MLSGPSLAGASEPQTDQGRARTPLGPGPPVETEGRQSDSLSQSALVASRAIDSPPSAPA